MSDLPKNSEEKLKILQEMQKNFLALSEEYKDAKSKIEEKVKERDQKVEALTQEQKKIEPQISELTAFGKEVEDDM